ncbi:MAG: DegT/DnrJ/EryC1/StrS family aminotransferase [Caldilineaceae bacterium]
MPGIATMKEADWAASVFWMYTIRIDAERYGMNSRQLLHTLENAQIQTRPLWQPIHLSPAHQGIQAYYCEQAELLNRTALSLPCSVGLSIQEQQQVTAIIQNC